MDGAARRAAERKKWPIRRYQLGDEPSDDLSATTTAAERLAMVWQLTFEAWRLAGRDIPSYSREATPGRVIRVAHESNG
jgi:hypothetical protein